MPPAPVQPPQRIQYLDILRGFAITGVLFAYVFWNLGTEPSTVYTTFDKIINQAGYFLIDSKCYTILASLFAVGFVLHMNKSTDLAKSLYTYRRRLAGLLIIGIFHALLLRNGDILVPYAILCFAVTFFYKSSNRVIIFSMVIVFLVNTMLPQLWVASGYFLPQRPVASGNNYWIENFAWVKYWYETSIFYWETTLFLLFTGLLIGRAFIQHRKKFSNGQLGMIIILGFTAGGLSYLIMTFYDSEIKALPDIGNTFIVRSTIYSLLDLIHKFGMASSYAAVFFLLSRNFRLRSLANLGRMSLTNYILQAAIIVPVCLILNLFDHITPTIAWVATAAIWILQIAFSNSWLTRYEFGPLEWLLRRFTYGKMRIRRKANHQMELISAPVMADN
jgi:uncharacterized protein